MSESAFNRLLEEAQVAKTGDYIDKGIIWAAERIFLLEKEKMSLAQHDCAQVLANDRLLLRIAELEAERRLLRGANQAAEAENKALREQVRWVRVGYMSMTAMEKLKNALGRDTYSISKTQEEPCFFPIYLPSPPQEQDK